MAFNVRMGSKSSWMYAVLNTQMIAPYFQWTVPRTTRIVVESIEIAFSATSTVMDNVESSVLRHAEAWLGSKLEALGVRHRAGGIGVLEQMGGLISCCVMFSISTSFGTPCRWGGTAFAPLDSSTNTVPVLDERSWVVGLRGQYSDDMVLGYSRKVREDRQWTRYPWPQVSLHSLLPWVFSLLAWMACAISLKPSVFIFKAFISNRLWVARPESTVSDVPLDITEARLFLWFQTARA